MDVDRSGATGELHAPNLLEQTLPGHDEARVVEQEREQVELHARQLYRTAGDRDRPPAALEHDVAARDDVHVLGCRLRAAQHCMDPRNELSRGERLRHVVVGAELEPCDPIDLLIACSDDHDRKP